MVYNGYSREALKAVDVIAQKADDELFCDVILVRNGCFFFIFWKLLTIFIFKMSNSIKNSIKLANNNEFVDLNGSKNTIMTTSPYVNKRQSAANSSIQTFNDENDEIDLNELDDEFASDFDLSRNSRSIQNNLAHVYIAPSAGERAEARRASMKLKKAKQSILNNEPPRAEINEFAKLDDIPNIDDSNGESGGGGAGNEDGTTNKEENEKKSKKKNNHRNGADILY